jgi:hypothetical protein
MREHLSGASVSLQTRRSDCQKYSPRQIVCRQYIHFFIGPRGGLAVATAEKGLKSEKTWICKMLRAEHA